MLTTIYKALSHPDRRRILALLREKPLLSGELAEQFEMSWPSLSRHLALLKEADLIGSERQGTKILYRVNTSVVEDAAASLLALVNPAAGPGDDTETETQDSTEEPKS